MDTGLVEVLLHLFIVFLCLLSHHFLVGLRVVSAQFKHLNVGRRIRVHILVDQGNYTLENVAHSDLCPPVLGLK